MKKTWLLSGLLLTTTLTPGFGQGRDTVFAVHKLFREKRGTAEGLGAAGSKAAADARYAQRPDGRPTAQEARQDALGNTAFTLAGAAKATRYSPENEAFVIRRYEAGNPLPADIRRKLKRRHFHRTAQDVGAPGPR